MSKVEIIPIQNLLIDLQNPRYDPRTNQREAILTIIIVLETDMRVRKSYFFAKN